MSTIKVGLIGCGGRSSSYVTNIPADMASSVEITAIADPIPYKMERFISKILPGRPRPRLYASGQELLAQEKIDALILGSINSAHMRDAAIAIERRIPTALEKPVVTRREDCRTIWQIYRNAGAPPVAVGFVLRYTPFYTQVHRMIREGAVGSLLSISADENLDTGLTSYYVRSPWRRWDKYTGGFMIEKCSHDFDIISWLADSVPVRVFSMAQRSHLVPSNKTDRLPYFDTEINPDPAIDYGSEQMKTLLDQTYFGSAYEDRHDLPDHQAVMIEYAGGLLATFTACMLQPYCTRRLKVFGVQGYLEGDIHRSTLIHEQIASPDGRQAKRTELPVQHDASGHHGGDSILNQHFWSIAAGKSSTVKAGLREGIEAVLIGLAADQSKQTGAAVDIRAWRQEVFGDEA